jgi:hypothetical protein
MILTSSAIGSRCYNFCCWIIRPSERRPFRHPKKRKAGKAKATDNTTEEAWRLEEHEEAVLLQVLLGALKRAFEDSKDEEKGDSFLPLAGS